MSLSINDVDGDGSSDDELPSLRKLLSPTAHLPRTPPRSHSLNLTVQTVGGPAPTPPGATSTPRKSPFKNVPTWSFLNSNKYASRELNEPAVRPPIVPNRCPFKSSSEREPVGDSVSGGHHINRGNSQENPIAIDDDDEDGDPIDQSNHISHQMTINDPGAGCENTNGDASGAAQMGEVVANSELDDASMSRDKDRSAIVAFTSSSPEIPESDSGATLVEERQLHPSVQGDFIASPPGKRSRSLSGSDRADGRGSDWVFDVFAGDDSGTEGDGSPASKRARSSPRLLEAAKNEPPPAATVIVKGVQVPDSAHDDRPLRGGQEYEVHQVVGESGSEYEVTALTKMWLPKAAVDPKLVRKYRAQQRAATRVRTRWSSRLQKKN